MDDAFSGKVALRRGWTTGTCAAAASAAAYRALLAGAFPDAVSVALPRGGTATLPIASRRCGEGSATAGVIKDAGDDPDVTHGAEVMATVAPGPPGSGVVFAAGPGVGTVTLPGLPVAVGEPAINPGPRAMIRAAIGCVAETFGASGDVVVTVSVPGGEALAEKTLNGRLGIVGGLSILGTTGVVVPFSCAAWVHSIHRGIDVARAAGFAHIAAATGSTSEAAVKRLYDLPDAALIDMGDFVGGTLKYLRRHRVPRLTIAGGFAKLVKLAQGHLFLHSSKSRVDMAVLAEALDRLDAPPGLRAEAAGANTAAQVLALARAHGLPLADAIAEGARATAARAVDDRVAIDVVVFDRAGNPVGRAGGHG
ncbi:MAG: cobalt-precorrin-5B (C(1))-methyltransferase [Rhodospirillales bacterium]|nr:cobalt-precorrin-5B (C(1))-methyltransferase [Rhodospirillales bacterium]